MILVDKFEPQEVLEALSEHARQASMDTGDYAFTTCSGQSVLIERKQVSDLLHSLSTGRLMDQLRRIIIESDIPILLVEGFITITKDGFVRYRAGKSRWRYTSVQNLILTAQLSGVYLIQSPSQYNTPRIILSLYKYFQKPEHTSLVRQKVFTVFPKDRDYKRAEMLMSLPGVGVEIATRMVERFGTPMTAFSASDEELNEVGGLGPKKIKAIRKFLDDPR